MSECLSQQKLAPQFKDLNALPIVTPTTPVPVVLQQMHQEQATCVLIVENKRLAGIFTERDLVRSITVCNNLDSLQISALMFSQVITLSETEASDLSIVLEYFRRYRIHHLPIVDAAGQLVSVITPESMRQMLHPSDLLRMRRVGEVMETRVVCAAPNTAIAEIAQLMATHQVSCVVIVEPESEEPLPIGIVTERDIVQFWASELDPVQTPVEQVMSAPLMPICPSETLWQANQQMQVCQVRRLVVMGAAGELKGIVTQTNIWQALDPIELAETVQSLQQLIEQKEQAFQQELTQRKLVEANLHNVNQTLHQTIEQSVLQRTQQLQDELEALRQRNQTLEEQLSYYTRTESSLEQLGRNRYFRGMVCELNVCLSNISRTTQMLEIVLKQMVGLGKIFPLLDPYFQILKDECETGMQVLQNLSKPDHE